MLFTPQRACKCSGGRAYVRACVLAFMHACARIGVWCVVCGVWCVVCGVWCFPPALSGRVPASRQWPSGQVQLP
eukprot:15446539-Alexandrium_andersonii.AAC.1